MRTFRLALAQINPTVGDLEGNARTIRQFLEEARAQKADLVAFPELSVTGYPPEDLVLKPSFVRDNRRVMEELAHAARGIGLVVGFVDADEHDIYNAAALAWDGRLVDVYRKMYLPNYGVFDEDRYFKAGRRCPVYRIRGVGVGVNVCEDIWYAVGPLPVQREAGAEVIVNINGSPYHAGKRLFREQMLATRASDNAVYVAYVNMVGGQDELVFDGGSMVFDSDGALVARARQFQEELLVVDLDVETVFRRRLHDPRPRKETAALLGEVGQGEMVHVSDPSSSPGPLLPPRIEEPLDPLGEVYHALVLGTRDYVRKSGFQKVLLGLSGGIDSSLTCCIAVDALGRENVVGVSMPSRYSSEGSLVDARALAQNLGIELRAIPIEPVHRAYEEVLAPFFQGTEAGVAEQNVQARIRGNLLMALSNKLGWLVLSTGDKSETAMGYVTLYGDMAGGFAVIKDVPKLLGYELARWRNAHGEPKNVVPQSVLSKPPSAELKPGQKTEEELMPYRVLDPVLKAYVEEDRSYEEMVSLGLDPQAVQRVIRTVDRNEYKRRQAAAGIKISPRAFGRDRRMPLVNRYPGL
jgi:NAD+ synthase (glutamine-hydrolysing)